MMNTKIYKAVHGLAEKLMKAANRQDSEQFHTLYAELKALCVEHENSEKDHPVQWETLADFTDDLDEAIVIYEKALEKATAINSKDFMSSIPFAMASLQVELGHTEAAIKNLEAAKISANNIMDEELRAEIDELLQTLLEDAKV